MKNSRLASWKTALPFLLPSLAGFVVFSIIPMIMQIFVSLTSWDGLSELTLFSDFSGFMDRFYVGIENYKEILTSKEFYQVIGNTLEFVILYIPLMLIASMIVALILNSHVKGVGIFRVLYYIPVITSWVAGALIWKFVARIDSITSNAGTNYETNALAAAIIGGVTFDGGKGTISGAFLGCLLMGVISNAMNILGVDNNVQTIITGAIIVAAVVLSNINNIKKK